MSEGFVTISQKLNPKGTERYWRKFVFPNNESKKVAILILQEPKYMDNRIEPALISAVNFVSNDYKQVYVCNLLPVVKKNIRVKNGLSGLMKGNICEIQKVISSEFSKSGFPVDIIYGARKATSLKNTKTGFGLFKIFTNFIEKNIDNNHVVFKVFIDRDKNLAYTSYGKPVNSIREATKNELKNL
ncbi:hypothetical protein [Lactococcus lactis]|uniref:Uncharacterized protein n=1 Tax=Lactococcus lactis TaxID=1358 RepID=A0AAP8E0U5_9LACT|nr:hypothetical protein [Lactococcus lactis]MDG4971417.1 hypothetical protein [Lactococcus lactis]PFG88809.1 hypothetical protein BW154_04760 [Lactococcus lactis]USI47453.1 hypothetical protein M5C73_08745 [Lactococcus lactis]